MKPEVALAQVNDPVRRDHEDHAVLEGLSLLDHSDGQRGVAGENLVQVTGPAGIQMLGNHDRRGEVDRQARDHARERLDAARR